ncbi:MAG TPA: hypothetical protein PKW93_10730 [Prolixibacteraceae bacterium]|nr:hypothetical protein [Prolixibacteraceae bacterium]
MFGEKRGEAYPAQEPSYHHNSLSVSFMVPKEKNGKPFRLFDRNGLWHCYLEFDEEGRL